ncbi:MAG: ABC-type amino acid transport substrate-binding protein [Enterobacterales bacterium]|jgi:ABC-type amino acid transport substrate-binding protein
MNSKPHLVIYFLLLTFCSVNTIQAEEKPSKPLIIYAVSNNQPFSFTLPDGTVTGLYVEFWELWSKTNNIPIQIKLASVAESLVDVKNKDAIHSGLFVSENREKWADFSLPIHQVSTGILYNRDYSKSTKLAETTNLKIAAYTATFQSEYLSNKYPNIEMFFYDDTEIGINKLLNNDIEAIVAEIPFLESQIARRGLNGVLAVADEILITNTVHALVAKGQPELLMMLNDGIENIPLSVLLALEKKWLPTISPFFKSISTFDALTLAEKKWLQQNTYFTLGIDSNWRPFEFLDDSNKYNGITADYLQFATDKLEIIFEPETSKSWTKGLELLKLGELDIVPAIMKTPEREKELLFTEPYFIAPTAIVTRKDSFYASTMSSLNNKKLGLISDYALIELVAKDYPDINIIKVYSVNDGLEKVDSGEIDAYINSVSVVNYEIDNKGFDNLMIAAFTPYKFEVSMAVRKGLEPLVPILNKTFKNMTQKEKSTIANTWLSIRIQEGTKLQTILLWGFPILAFFLLVILLIMRINNRLNSEINTRIESEEKRLTLENQLHQSQKMEALGKLTGGIAHDFNNMLGIIIGYSSLLKKQSLAPETLSKYTQEIHYAATRGANLTKKLLSFTQTHSPNASQVDINQLLIEQRDMLQKTLTVRIKLEFNLNDNIGPIWVDKNDIEDTILNISINAMHAMIDKNIDAKLSISTSNRSLSSDEATALNIEVGDYVLLSIADNGLGMDSELKQKIFEPFYTTKGERGSGLGLSQVFGFTQRSNSTIKVSSELGKGSEFTLYFPRLTNLTTKQQIKKVTKPEINISGDETILVVDDEEALQTLASELLKAQGYQVFCASSGAEALQILSEKKIDLVFSDVLMPQMNGYQLAYQIHKKYPTVKIQLVSGFSDECHLSVTDQNLYQKILNKPYNLTELQQKIRFTLNS